MLWRAVYKHLDQELMERNQFTVMAITASHNRIGFCFLIDRQPMDWQLAHKAAQSPECTKQKVLEWLMFYAPDVVITEDLSGSLRKGRKAQHLILAIKDAVLEADVQHIEVTRAQPFANKYDQIKNLCEQFPQMKAVAPRKRKLFETEPPYTTIFECLALAQQVIR